MYKIMTPGPTQVAENVRLARSRECTNPDLVRSSTPEITVKHLMYRNSKTSSKNITITNTQPLSTEIHQAVC